MDKKNILPYILIFIIGSAFGITGTLVYNIDPVVSIISVEDNQEVHSIIVIDAIFDKGDEVGVWINETKVANYLPYYWNNMLYPVGDWEIAVGVNKNDKWEYDNITVTIPEEFIVPIDYEFDENFVVHEGQTVYMNYDFIIGGNGLDNGWNSIDDITYFSINNYGTLYINGNITCNNFICEGNSTTNWNSGNITVLEHNFNTFPEHGFLRFDDNAVLNIYNNKPIITFTEEICNNVNMLSLGIDTPENSTVYEQILFYDYSYYNYF